MVARQHLCDRNRLHRLLDEDLNENEERKLIKHLDACDGALELADVRVDVLREALRDL